jgi:hypothetical protein
MPFKAMLKKKHIMIDLETLSTHQNAVIVQIGAVKFDFNGGMTDEFLINIDMQDSMKYHLHIEKETVEWWAKQDKEIRMSWQTDKHTLKDAMTQFNGFVDTQSLLWSNGAPFDMSILRWSIEEVGLKRGWSWWNEIDFRSLNTLFDNRLPKGNTHNAMDDCKHQIGHLMNFMKMLSDS